MSESDEHRAGYAAALEDVKRVLGPRMSVFELLRAVEVVLAMEPPQPPIEVTVTVIERKPDPEPERPPMTEAEADLVAAVRPYAAVFQRAHELGQAHPNTPIGQLIDRAKRETGISVPPDVEVAIVKSLYKLIVRGFPSKVDA